MECKKELVWMYLLIIISFVTSIFPAWVGFSPQCLKIEMKGNLNLTVFVQTKKPNHISKKKKKTTQQVLSVLSWSLFLLKVIVFF